MFPIVNTIVGINEKLLQNLKASQKQIFSGGDMLKLMAIAQPSNQSRRKKSKKQVNIENIDAVTLGETLKKFTPFLKVIQFF